MHPRTAVEVENLDTVAGTAPVVTAGVEGARVASSYVPSLRAGGT